jgi:UDP-N-acetylmuramoyl-L-alanyl-D-glutamate--2,6-diaminopimelate ligase
MKIEQLLDQIHTYSGVTADSAEVRKGFVFVAQRGNRYDGHSFIQDALERGATTIVGDRELAASLKVPYIYVNDSQTAFALLADAYYRSPSRELIMVGVTGTCGKTTTTYILESILTSCGYKAGVIGTENIRYPGFVQASTHTTPQAMQLQDAISQMRNAECQAVVMEVSSHALKQQRTKGILFDVMMFTNLSHDHLDFHGNMEDYFQSKVLLFTEYARDSVSAGKRPCAVINADDEYGRRLIQIIREQATEFDQVISFGLSENCDVSGTLLDLDTKGISGLIDDHSIRSSLVGMFNAFNITGAVAASKALKLQPGCIEIGVTALKSVPGRLETVSHGSVNVFVDHSHKPGALEAVLNTLNKLKGQHQLIVVFGCGGDRDPSKRPEMGAIASRLADRVWITSDNPRTEDPESIIRHILVGVLPGKPIFVNPDRRQAIHASIAEASAGDIVVIAGKGSETYQILAAPNEREGVYKIHFDDREVAREALGNDSVVVESSLAYLD